MQLIDALAFVGSLPNARTQDTPALFPGATSPPAGIDQVTMSPCPDTNTSAPWFGTGLGAAFHHALNSETDTS